jgi:hypothetical protein
MGAGQSTPLTPSSPSTPSPPSSSSSTSPFSLPSPVSSPPNLCEISKKQVEDFEKEIKFLKDSEVHLQQRISEKVVLNSKGSDFESKMFHLNAADFETKEAYLNDPVMSDPLFIKQRIFCLMLIDILKKYNEILEKINELCIKCKTDEAVDNVDDKINDIIGEYFIKAHSWFNSFNRFYVSQGSAWDLHISSLKLKLNNIEEMFKDVEKIKREMMAVCTERQKSQEGRSVAFTAKGFGGKSSRTRSKKRKQMKMKMKGSNSLSKTRNHKKKYNNGKCVKK